MISLNFFLLDFHRKTSSRNIIFDTFKAVSIHNCVPCYLAYFNLLQIMKHLRLLENEFYEFDFYVKTQKNFSVKFTLAKPQEN